MKNKPPLFDDNEILQSHLPAAALLAKLGYSYLPLDDANRLRGRMANVLLDDVLRAQLARINQITFKGRQRAFSQSSIEKAIQKLKDVSLIGGQIAAASDTYDLLTLGESFDETIDGETKAFSLRYIAGASRGTTSSTSPRSLRCRVSAAATPTGRTSCSSSMGFPSR